MLLWFGASACRLSRRETLLPCSVGVVQALGIRFCALGIEAWEKASAMRYEWLLLWEAEGG